MYASAVGCSWRMFLLTAVSHLDFSKWAEWSSSTTRARLGMLPKLPLSSSKLSETACRSYTERYSMEPYQQNIKYPPVYFMQFLLDLPLSWDYCNPKFRQVVANRPPSPPLRSWQLVIKRWISTIATFVEFVRQLPSDFCFRSAYSCHRTFGKRKQKSYRLHQNPKSRDQRKLVSDVTRLTTRAPRLSTSVVSPPARTSCSCQIWSITIFAATRELFSLHRYEFKSDTSSSRRR